MTQFCITYLGGSEPKSPEAGQKQFSDYKAWLEGLGDAAVSPMNPLKGTVTISSAGVVSGGSSVGMSGYTIIEAESAEVALKIAKACPFLETGGSLEVAELIKM